MRAPTGERQGHPSTHEDRVSGPVSKCARTEGGLLEGAPRTASVPRGAYRVALATRGGLLRAVAGRTRWQHERGEGGGAAGVVRADGALGGREVRLSAAGMAATLSAPELLRRLIATSPDLHPPWMPLT